MEYLSSLDVCFLHFGFGGFLLAFLRFLLGRLTSKPSIPPTFPLLTSTQKSASSVLPPTRSIKKRLEQTGRRYIIFFGSQTGTAEKYALRFSKEANARYNLESLVGDLDDFDYNDLETLSSDSPVAFFLATYGEGEPTDSTIAFKQYLDKSKAKSGSTSLFSSLQYSAFGLGSSSYTQYNAMIKKTSGILDACGARLIGDVGLGDDGKGTLEEDYLEWKEKTFSALSIQLGLPEVEYEFKPDFSVKESSSGTSNDIFLGEPNTKHLRNKISGPFTATNPYPAHVIQAADLFTSGNRKCLHLEFDVSGTSVRYETGDHLAVWPTNSNEKVERFLEVFGLHSTGDLPIQIASNSLSVKVPIPAKTTYRAAARHYLDIGAPVPRHLLTTLATLVNSESKRTALLSLSNDRLQFQQQVTGPRLNLAETLLLAASGQFFAEVPFCFLLEHIGKLQPRHYSISSSSLVATSRISITAVVDSYTAIGSETTFHGCNTSYLSALKSCFLAETPAVATHTIHGPRGIFSGPTALIHVRRSKFRLPRQSSTPIIMIGPGTGVAPFRAFVQERAASARAGKEVGRTLLFYGCRKRSEDFLYEDEWRQHEKYFASGVFSMSTAFSRDENVKKQYVQDLLEEQAEEVRDLILRKGAVVYVCGDAARMAKSVFTTVGRIVEGGGGEDYLRTLKTERRWNEDVW